MIKGITSKRERLIFGVFLLICNFSAVSFAGLCEADTKQYCSGAQPGSDQAIECLKDHYKDVSQECYDSLAQKQQPEQQQSDQQQSSNGFRQICREDAKKYCADVQPGGGRIKNCLMDHSQELSQNCYDVLAKMKQETGNGFGQFCREDAKKYCTDVQSGGGRIKNCLMDHSQELSQDCYDVLAKMKK